MTETATQPPEGQEPSPEGQAPNSPEGQQPPATPPPWGDDFQPERAWNTIQELRNEVKQAQLEKRTREREGMSEMERLKAENEDLAKELRSQRVETLRSQVLVSRGLPANAASFLHGDSLEELERNADALKAMIGTSQPQPAGQPDFGAGARPNGGTNGDDFSAQLRRAAGFPR
jgi:hypothetical protein